MANLILILSVAFGAMGVIFLAYRAGHADAGREQARRIADAQKRGADEMAKPRSTDDTINDLENGRF